MVLAEHLTVVPVAVAVAQEGGKAVADKPWLEQRIAVANALFSAHGLKFKLISIKTLPARHSRLLSRDDRDALGVYVKKGVLNLFVVAYSKDVDDPSQKRRGVHWHQRSATNKHFVILANYSSPTVLAHELGHFFGNPKHSDVPDNLMSYTRRGGKLFLDQEQSRRIRESLKRYLSTAELVLSEQSSQEYRCINPVPKTSQSNCSVPEQIP
ncbi:MAG: hypothetical protein IPJ88_12150 [Myxococcales bacterium]|nr:MAG: hypothetical protein IPJ88_12150 [Myxococcales bacterium]